MAKPPTHHTPLPRPQFPELTQAQHALLSNLTDQNCVDLIDALEIMSELSPEKREMLRAMKPETVSFLTDLRPEEVKGLKAYLVLRSTGSYLAWGVGTLIAGVVAVNAFYGVISGWIAGRH